MNKILKADCNRCDKKGCRGTVNPSIKCDAYIKPRDTFKLGELALAYPDNLNKSLSALPFETNLNFYLR